MRLNSPDTQVGWEEDNPLHFSLLGAFSSLKQITREASTHTHTHRERERERETDRQTLNGRYMPETMHQLMFSSVQSGANVNSLKC